MSICRSGIPKWAQGWHAARTKLSPRLPRRLGYLYAGCDCGFPYARDTRFYSFPIAVSISVLSLLPRRFAPMPFGDDRLSPGQMSPILLPEPVDE